MNSQEGLSYESFSVLMSVYRNEKPEFFKASMESVLGQSLKPNEIVLVRDGKVTEELQGYIDYYVHTYKCIKYVPLEDNIGLGRALDYGLQFVKNEIVARMDTDDICVQNRFEKQLNYMKNNPEIDVLGGQIMEFIDSPEHSRGIRSVPESHDAILKYLKRRNPFNHMTVMFKKEKVKSAGSYMDMYFIEDYYLWCRMALLGCKFANLSEIIVYARTGQDMFKRRGGYKYFLSWKQIESFKLKNGITNRWQYIKTLCMRFFIQVLMLPSTRGFILEKFSRKHPD